MGSVSNSLSSSNSVTSTANTLSNTPVTSSNSGSSSNTTGIFTGTSAYSSDLQNLISRAVAIADLPIGIMTDDQTALTSQATELTTMDTDFTALQNAVQGISDALAGSSLTGTSTDPTAVTATLGDGATGGGSYSIKVDNAGAYASSLSTATWNTTSTLTSAQTANYELVVGNQEYSVSTTDNSAAGVAAAIQAQYGSLVNAAAVNVRSSDARISLTSATLGPVNLDLMAVPAPTAPASLQTVDSTGYALSQTTRTWTGPADTLVVNGTSYAIAPASSSAQDVVTAINSAATANSLPVYASVVNVGTSTVPDDRIQLEGATPGVLTMDIQDGSNPGLQTQETPASGYAISQTASTWSGPADRVVVNGISYAIAPNSSSAQDVVAAINSAATANSLPVYASVVNVGTAAAPDDRIQLAGTTPGVMTLDIQDGSNPGLEAQETRATGYALSQTSSTWAGPADTLLVNGISYAIAPNSSSAQDVAAAINSAATANSLPVYASVVNVGTAAAPDDRIQLAGTKPGVMTLDIQDGSNPGLQRQETPATGYALSQTTSTWAGPADTLVVNGSSYAIAPNSSSAQDVVTAINSAATANSLGVYASVVNVGTTAAPDYRIQLAGTTTGVRTLDIQDGSNPGLQTQETPATSLSSATWTGAADRPGTQSQYALVVGSSTYKVVATDNSAQTVAAAINAQYGTLVHASVVDLTGSGDYRIALQDETGDTPIPTLDIQKSVATVPAGLEQQSSPGWAISQTTNTWSAAGGTYKLLVNGTSYALSPTTASAQDVATAINAAATANHLAVNATVVDLGTSTAHDYRIQLEGTTAGFMTLGIQNGTGANLQTQQVYATSRTAATWNAAPDAVGTRSQYTLAIGAKTYNFITADNSAQTVASAINSQFGSLVNATVVDATGSGDYRIALQSRSSTTPIMDIQKTTCTSLQTSHTTGVLATYELDGAPPATSDTPYVTVSNGVTLNLLGPTGGTAGPTNGPAALVTVSMSATALSTALSTFTTAYNTCVDEVVKQRGTNAGPLQGSPILNSLSEALSSIATYNTSSGDVNTLSSLGLSLSQNTIDGHFTYDGGLSVLGLNFGDTAGLTSFLGSLTGGGFLGAVNTTLNNLEDPTNGLLKTSETDTQAQITNIGNQITAKQDQVNQMQTQLTAQMAAADAAIASMEQQYSYISEMFQAQQTANQMYTQG